MAQNHPPLTPHSRLLARGCVDGRSREGRYLAACRAELVPHVGGNPSATQRVTIDRVAWLRLHVMLLDEKVAGGKALTEHDRRTYCAFSNSLVRAMRELGMAPAAARPLDALTYLAQKRAADAAA
jgi:hypothetical protein